MKRKFKLVGRPASKKNSRIVLKKQGRVIDIPSNAYRTYKKSCLEQITEQLGAKIRLMKPWYIVEVEVFYKTMVRLDGDNVLSSILDIFQDAGVITDDKMVGKSSVTMHLNTREEDYLLVTVFEVDEKDFVVA